MKKIGYGVRSEVIKLFFHGCSYDEIKDRIGIAKGTVANIIQEFKDGLLPEPPELIDYIDELRKVAVDLKRHRMNPKDINSYIRINNRFMEMDVDIGELKELLQVYRTIVISGIPKDSFVGAAMELARLVKENGVSYNDLLRDYMIKVRKIDEIDRELEIKKAEIKELSGKKDDDLKLKTHRNKITYFTSGGDSHRHRNFIWCNGSEKLHFVRGNQVSGRVTMCENSVNKKQALSDLTN